MPGAKIGNGLAESWTESADGLVYEFKLRQGLRFHNDEPCTAEDVKFSFERYKGGGAAELRANVQRGELPERQRRSSEDAHHGLRRFLHRLVGEKAARDGCGVSGGGAYYQLHPIAPRPGL